MKSNRIVRLSLTVALTGALLLPAPMAWARPSMGHVGGGGGGRPGGGAMARPSMPHGPSMNNMARPNVSRPSLPSAHMPNLPQSRPAPAGRPTNLGGVSQQRPQTRPAPPGAANNPVSKLPSQQMRPATRPAPRPDRPIAGPSTKPAPDFGRPNVRPPGGGDRPGVNRPNNDLVNANRPGANRPDLNRPGGGNRPGPNRPGRPDGNWPGGNGPGDRPSLGGINRPTTLPGNLGNNNRPSIGGNRPNRPGGNNNIINNNTNNNLVINNRPNNINRPGNWGNWNGNNWNGNWNGRPGYNNNWNNHHWNDHWYDHHVNNYYHNWYHGCWHGHYDYNWYVPLAIGATAWGLSALTPWTYGGVAYYNPYYTVPTTTVVTSAPPAYDYSQPIVLNNYVTTDSSSNQQGAAAAPSAAETESLSMVDQFRQEFYDQKYADSLVSIEKALKVSPKDPVVHELRALNLFALTDYNRAAAALNSLLASAPGMDWTTMSTLYSDTDVYTAQLRKLEDHLRKNPKDASGSFVLAYHYMVLGEDDAAENALRTVVQEQPRDLVAKRILDSMTAGDAEAEKPAADPQAPATPPATPQPSSVAEKEQPAAPQADLVGKWLAKSGDTTVELNVDDKSQFSWKVQAKDQPEVQIAGQLASTPTTLILDGGDQGTLVAQVTPKTANQFEFAMQGAPAESKLVFDRQ